MTLLTHSSKNMLSFSPSPPHISPPFWNTHFSDIELKTLRRQSIFHMSAKASNHLSKPDIWIYGNHVSSFYWKLNCCESVFQSRSKILNFFIFFCIPFYLSKCKKYYCSQWDNVSFPIHIVTVSCHIIPIGLLKKQKFPIQNIVYVRLKCFLSEVWNCDKLNCQLS